VTCGYLHGGCSFDFSDDSRLGVSAFCHEHVDMLKEELTEKKKSQKNQEIPHENGLVVPIKLPSSKKTEFAKIFSSQPQIYYEVDFGDGTFSNDMQPEDVINHNIELDSIPKPGSLVKVKWDDKTICTCTFLGYNKTFLYTLKLLDPNGELVTIKKSHKELTSLIQTGFKSSSVSNLRSDKKNVLQQGRLSRSNRETINLENKILKPENADNHEAPITNENLKNLITNSDEYNENKREKIILKLNLKNFNVVSQVVDNSVQLSKRKCSFSSFSSDEQTGFANLNDEKKYFKNEIKESNLETTLDCLNVKRNKDANVNFTDEDYDIAAAASAMMELSNSVY
jgi:hypothetical protein